MKKLLLSVILLSTVYLSARGFASIRGEYKGLISGVEFTPLQLSICSAEKMQLFDETACSICSFGVLAVYQEFSIISAAPLCGVNNYFLQVAALSNFDGDSRGIAIAPINAHNKNYGLQTGLLNWSDDKKWGMQAGIYNENGLLQLGLFNYDGLLQVGFYNEGYYWITEKDMTGFQLGLLNNCGDNACIQVGAINGDGEFQFGIVNVSGKDGIQVGLFNACKDSRIVERNTSIQIGLLNYNPRSYIPYLPLINWDMGQGSKSDSAK